MVRDTDARSAACSTVGEGVPLSISARVAAISSLRVRAFCRVRPDSSYAVDMAFTVP